MYDKCMIITIDTEKDVTPEQLRKILNILSPPRSTINSRKKSENVRKPYETGPNEPYFDDNYVDPDSPVPTPDVTELKLNPNPPKNLPTLPEGHLITTYVPFTNYPKVKYGMIEEYVPASTELPTNYKDLDKLPSIICREAEFNEQTIDAFMADVLKFAQN